MVSGYGTDVNNTIHLQLLTEVTNFTNTYLCVCVFYVALQDLESKEMVEELRPEIVSQTSKAEPPQCLSLAWSTDGQTLFAGYSDNTIRVWQVSISAR